MKKHYLLASISIFGWSTAATVIKLLLGSLDSMQVICVSTLFAALFLLAISIFTGTIKKLRAYTLKDYVISVLIGLPGAFFYYVFYYTGTAIMPSASQAFIVNYLWPIMSVVFACLILKEKMTAKKITALLLSFTGVIVVMGKNLLMLDWTTLGGALFCILGAISYGSFTALNQKFKYDKRISLTIAYFTSFILTSAYNLINGSFPALNGLQLIGIGWNGIITIGLSAVCWQFALESGDTARVSNLAYVTPFLSLIWTWVFLNEPLTPLSVIGLAFIMLGILIQLKSTKKHA